MEAGQSRDSTTFLLTITYVVANISPHSVPQVHLDKPLLPWFTTHVVCENSHLRRTSLYLPHPTIQKLLHLKLLLTATQPQARAVGGEGTDNFHNHKTLISPSSIINTCQRKITARCFALKHISHGANLQAAR